MPGDLDLVLRALRRKLLSSTPQKAQQSFSGPGGVQMPSAMLPRILSLSFVSRDLGFPGPTLRRESRHVMNQLIAPLCVLKREGWKLFAHSRAGAYFSFGLLFLFKEETER